MIDLDDLLAPLAGADLGEPPAVDHLRARAAARAASGRRRRLAIASATASFLLVVGTAFVVVLTGRPVGLDTVEPATPSTAPALPTPADEDGGAVPEPLPVGRFPSDMAVDGADLWVLNRTSGDLTRIATDEHRVVSTIPLLDGPRGADPKRVAVGGGSVWVAGVPAWSGPGGELIGIDTATEERTVVATTVEPFAVAWSTDGIWVAGPTTVGAGAQARPEAAVQRVDPDTNEVGEPIALGAPGFAVDVAVTDDGLWVLVQAPGPSRLVNLDPATGQVVGSVDIDASAVRLVATDDELVIGTDTSGNSGRTGAVTLVDPSTRTVVATTALDVRPDAIVLVDDLIVTTGLRVLDRETLVEHPTPGQPAGLGMALARDGDSLWAALPENPNGPAQVRRIRLDTIRDTIADESDPSAPPGWRLIDYAEVRFAVPEDWDVPESARCVAGDPVNGGVVLLPTTSTEVCSSGVPTPQPPSVVRITEDAGDAVGTPARIGTLDATLLDPSLCSSCPPTFQLESGLRIFVTGPEAAAVLSTFTDSGARQALADGPLADRDGWRTVTFGGVSVDVPPEWPMVDLPGSSTVTTDAEGNITGQGGRIDPGMCGGDLFGRSGEVFLGESLIVPDCAPPTQLAVEPGVGLWVRAFPDVGHSTFAVETYEGPASADLEIVRDPPDRTVRQPVLDIVLDGPKGPIWLTVGSRTDPATIRSILASVRLGA